MFARGAHPPASCTVSCVADCSRIGKRDDAGRRMDLQITSECWRTDRSGRLLLAGGASGVIVTLLPIATVVSA